MLNCGISICISYPRSIPIKSSTWMNLGATQELGLDEPDGHPGGRPPSRSLIFIVDSDIRSSQHIHRMGSYFRACSRAPLIVLCLRASLSSFFIIAASLFRDRKESELGRRPTTRMCGPNGHLAFLFDCRQHLQTFAKPASPECTKF